MGVGGAPIQTMSAKGQNMVKCWEWCESKRKICSISSKQSSQWDRRERKEEGGERKRERGIKVMDVTEQCFATKMRLRDMIDKL